MAYASLVAEKDELKMRKIAPAAIKRVCSGTPPAARFAEMS